MEGTSLLVWLLAYLHFKSFANDFVVAPMIFWMHVRLQNSQAPPFQNVMSK